MSPEPQTPDQPGALDPSRPLRDPQREAFCQELAAGEHLYDAYETAGFKRPRGNAQRMFHEDEVSQRLGWLLARVAPLDEAMLGYRRLEHRRALEHIANGDRLSLFQEKTRYTTAGKRRKAYRSIELKAFEHLGPSERALIDGIEITDKGGVRVLMPKRLEARAMLAKLDGLLVDRHDHSVEVKHEDFVATLRRRRAERELADGGGAGGAGG